MGDGSGRPAFAELTGCWDGERVLRCAKSLDEPGSSGAFSDQHPVEVRVVNLGDAGSAKEVGEARCASGLAFLCECAHCCMRHLKLPHIANSVSSVQPKNSNQGEIFSARMRALREDCSLSQDALATALGISRNYVSMLELGRKQPSAQLTKAFDAFEESQIRRNRIISEIVEHEDAAVRQRLRDESPADMLSHHSRRSSTPSSVRPLTAPALITSKLTEAEILQSIEVSVMKMREDPNPVMRLGYLNTIRTLVDDMERRLAE